MALCKSIMLGAKIESSGKVFIKNQPLGKVQGFLFLLNPEVTESTSQINRSELIEFIRKEITKRCMQFLACSDNDISIDNSANLRWLGEPVAKLTASNEPLYPDVMLLANTEMISTQQDKIKKRLERWLKNQVSDYLRPLLELKSDQTLTRNESFIASKIITNWGIIQRHKIHRMINNLNQESRKKLRHHGIKFGEWHIFIPSLLKKKPVNLICHLWSVKNFTSNQNGLYEIPQLLATGQTSLTLEPSYNPQIYNICGYKIFGEKCIRIDILERLASMIRAALDWDTNNKCKYSIPDGAYNGKTFFITPSMLSILGASYNSISTILKTMGYKNKTELVSSEMGVPENYFFYKKEETKITDTENTLGLKGNDKTDEKINITLWYRNLHGSPEKEKRKNRHTESTDKKLRANNKNTHKNHSANIHPELAKLAQIKKQMKWDKK